MSLIFGFDIGTTSIGFAVIDHDRDRSEGEIRRLGVRIFPEARDPKGIPWNQERRQARLRRRQLRRRRKRLQVLADWLNQAGLLPLRSSPDWDECMRLDPYDLRRRASEGEALAPHEIGRAIYHLAKRRHFKTRDLEEVSGDASPEADDADEKEAKSDRERTIEALRRENKTLGAWLASHGPHERKRGKHATREYVEREFDEIWSPLLLERFRKSIRDAIFFQRPVFWRLNTLGKCPFIPGADLCPKGSWLSQQRRMLEKLNNLEIVGGDPRPLKEEERQAILAKLQTQESMTWPGVRRALTRLYKDRGEAGAEKALRFNLEEGGEKKLLGNPVEKKLESIFGKESWMDHPRKQEIRDSIPAILMDSDYGKIGVQRMVIRPAGERLKRRAKVARDCAMEFDLQDDQAEQLEEWKLPSGWEPYSVEALQEMLPHLEKGARFGEIINGPDLEEWRAHTFPQRDQPTGEVLDRLPSPADREERKRIAALRNPTVARARNELRKVVNNLIGMFGKPDLIRVEVARDVGNSKRHREEKRQGIKRQERRRKAALGDLQEKGLSAPSRADIEKWLLWKECGHRCPYTGDSISFDSLFRTGDFEVEHIWPRHRSLDDSFRNKTLCRRDVNIQKGDRIPYELFSNNQEGWDALVNRLYGMKAVRGGIGMSYGKIRRFLATSIPDDFASRQLNDTGYAAREAVVYMKMLWPDIGPDAPVKVSAVSGKVTAHLRRLWGLNNILSEDGEKTRADHRHHAIDALTVACCHQGMTQKLSRYWQREDRSTDPSLILTPPWEAIRSDAEKAVEAIVVSHRVRKKVSGPLHKETIYGDTEENDSDGRITYRYFVTRKSLKDLSKDYLKGNKKDLWPDQKIRDIVVSWINGHGGDPKKAFPPYPKRSHKGPEIRKTRLRVKQKINLMADVSTGYADLGKNHHIAIYRQANGSIKHEVVSLLEASRRVARREPVVRRKRHEDERFVMSLSPGDLIELKEDGETRIRVVTSVWSGGQVVVTDHNDAVNSTVYRPNAKKIVEKGGRKLSVDPIGRIRPAND